MFPLERTMVMYPWQPCGLCVRCSRIFISSRAVRVDTPVDSACIVS